MTVLITGGSGFVGLNMAEQLLDRGDDVVLFGPAAPPSAALSLFSQAPGRLSVVTGDVCAAADLDTVFALHPIDRVVHAAAITADLDREKRAARDIFAVNLLGTVEVLEASLRHSVRRVVQLGTGSVYGAAGTTDGDLDEQASPALPETLYGISKYAAERTGLRYRQTRGLDLVVARLGMVFGRWEYDTGVRDTLSLPLQIYHAARAGRAVVVHRTASDDWVYASDVARGLAAILDAPHRGEGVYHLSSGMGWSVEQWCLLLQTRFPGFRYRLSDDLGSCTIGRNAARPRSRLSIARICRDTPYRPAFPMERAFQDFMRWHENSCIRGERVFSMAPQA